MDKIILIENDKNDILKVASYEKEYELQELIKSNPTVIEISSIFDSPLLIIGRESFRIDVLGITLSGIPVIIECKRKENPDMRYLIAQIFEYGSLLQSKSFDELDSCSKNYFNSEKCEEKEYKGKTLIEALNILNDKSPEYDNVTEENIQNIIIQNLKNGNFILIVVADEFDEVSKRTINFLNSKLNDIYIEIVEVKKFSKSKTSVFVPLHINPLEKDNIHTKKSVGNITIEEMKSHGTTKQCENLMQIKQVWENHENCSAVLATSGISMRYKKYGIFYLFIDHFRLGDQLKRQITKNGLEDELFNKIQIIFGEQYERRAYLELINMNECKETIEKIYKIIKDAM